VTSEQDTSRTQAPAAEEAAGEPVEPERPEAPEEAAEQPGHEPAERPGMHEEAAEQPDAREEAAEPPGMPDEAPAQPQARQPEATDEPDYKDQWLRAAADLDNVRKRARRDVAVAETRGIAKLARELLPALDNFERALASAEAQPENRDHHLTDGIRLVQTELLAALARVGIVPDSPNGERFDPHRHEALAQRPVDGTETGTIVEVYNAGYTYGDEVLRPAKVVVAA
jgi:molecular chaperone GrpE